MKPKINNILIYGRVDEEKFIEAHGVKLPIGCGGLQKNLILALTILKKKFNVHLALCGVLSKEKYKADGINVLFFGTRKVNLGIEFYFSFLKELIKRTPFNLANLKKSETVVIVYNEFPLCLLTKILHPQFTVILVIESNYPQLFWRPRGNLFLKIISLFILIATIPLTDKIIKIRNHPWVFEKFIPFLKKKSYFLPNSVDRKLFSPPSYNLKKSEREKIGFKENDFILLYAGRLNDIEYKNPELLFKSFAIIKKTVLNAKLLIAGITKEDLDILFKVYSIKDTSNIFLTEHIPNDLMSTYYQLSDLTLLTSNSEGCPYVILESLACGTPCIVTDVLESGLITNGVNGYISKSKTAPDFANAVIQGIKLSRIVKNRDLLDPIYNIENREANLLRILE